MWPVLYKTLSLLAINLNGFIGQLNKFETLSIEDFLCKHGYPLETHEVMTEDGYILTIHRIPYVRRDRTSNDTHTSQSPVFLLPGILQSSMDWLILGRKSMGLILADAGYDVWLGNNRGNTYSKKHKYLDPLLDAKEFFNYSYHEIGIYDLPTMIDYVLTTTKSKKLSYFGYSEGFTSFAVMGSLKPEYNDKILIANAFAPMVDLAGFYELFSNDRVSNWFRSICFLSESLCKIFFNLIGLSNEQLPEKEFLITILAYFPAGMSLKQISHYVQGTKSGKFGGYDYGSQKNIKVYGCDVPPSYNLSQITAPIVLYYGDSDVYVNNNVLLNSVAKDLPNVVKIFLIPYPNCDHLDLVYGKNISALTSEALRNTNRYNNLKSKN